MKTEDKSILNSPYLHLLVIVLLGIAVYLNSLHVPFTLDDKPNIVNSPVVKNFNSLLDAAQLKCDLLEPKLKPQFASRIVGYLTFFANYKIGGLSVIGYHLVNIGIHLVNALLTYLIVLVLGQMMLQQKAGENIEETNSFRLLAFFSALLFVIHPIQTQAVTYIVQRFTSLATLFYLLSIACYLKSRNAESKKNTVLFYLGACISAILAMKTKEFAFTLPIMLTLTDFMFIKTEIRKRMLYLLPFYILLAIIPLTFVAAAKGAVGGISASSLEFGSSLDVSRWDYFITQLTVIVKYLALLFPPVIQNLDYDYPLYHSVTNPRVLGAAALLVSLLCLGFYLLKVSRRATWYANHARIISFGIFWFFIAVAAESSIIRIRDLIFEHRLYLPSIGFFIAITSSVMVLKGYLHRRESLLEIVVTPCAIFIIFLLSFATYARNIVWQDEIWLWEDTVVKSPNKPRPHNYLALLYYDRGLYDKALQENIISYKLKPDPKIHLNLGNICLKVNLYEEAVKEFKTAIAMDFDPAKAYNGICVAYYQQKRYPDAIQACEKAVKIKADYSEAFNMLGMIAFEHGDMERALRNFNAAISGKPDSAIAHNNAGNAYFKMKNYDAALKEYAAVSLLDSSYIGIHLSIAKVYHEIGRLNDAVHECRLALQQKPDFTESRKLLELLQREIDDKKATGR